MAAVAKGCLALMLLVLVMAHASSAPSKKCKGLLRRWSKKGCDTMVDISGSKKCTRHKKKLDANDCSLPTLAVDGGWGAWTVYGACSVTCGSGSHTRTRTCDSPAPENGGATCVGDAEETAACNDGDCPVPVNGGWSAWSAYGACSAGCGSGNHTRTRTCDSPAPQNGGDACSGDASETSTCSDGEVDGDAVFAKHPVSCPVQHGWAMCVKGTVPSSCAKFQVNLYDAAGQWPMMMVDLRFHYVVRFMGTQVYDNVAQLVDRDEWGDYGTEQTMDVFPFAANSPIALTIRRHDANTLQLEGNGQVMGQFTSSLRDIDDIAYVEVTTYDCDMRDSYFDVNSACE